jgi:hypothetical protein
MLHAKNICAHLQGFGWCPILLSRTPMIRHDTSECCGAHTGLRMTAVDLRSPRNPAPLRARLWGMPCGTANSLDNTKSICFRVVGCRQTDQR